MKESLPYSTRSRLDENPHSFTNKQEFDYAATWLKETTVSDMMAGEPKFYDKPGMHITGYMEELDGSGNLIGKRIPQYADHVAGDRIDRRVEDPEQAMAEANAAKPYMDLATKYFELIKQDSGDIESTTDVYDETWDGKIFFAGEIPTWAADYDGLGALIAMGKDAAYDAGKERLVGPLPWQKDFLEYMSLEVDAYKKYLAAPDELFNKLHNKDSARAFMDSIVADLSKQTATAKTAKERQALYKKIQDVEGFGMKVSDPVKYARLNDVPGYPDDNPGNDFVHYQRQLQWLEESNDTTEVAKNGKAVIQEELAKAELALAERTRRNKEMISALAVFEDYIKVSSKPVPSAETNSRDEDVRRQREAIDRLFLGSKKQKEQSGTSSKEAASMPEARAQDIVPDDPVELEKFGDEFFTHEAMNDDNLPTLREYMKKVLLVNARELDAARKEKNDDGIFYSDRMTVLVGTRAEEAYKGQGAAIFMYNTIKDRFTVEQDGKKQPINYSAFRGMKMDMALRALGVDVREVVPDYYDKFAS